MSARYVMIASQKTHPPKVLFLSVVILYLVDVEQHQSVLGANSEAHGVSIGINATTSFSSVAVGVESKSSGKNAVAMGSSAKPKQIMRLPLLRGFCKETI